MARTVRYHRLETRAARERLVVREEPYWCLLEEGCHLGYFRGRRQGKWVARFRQRSAAGGYAKLRLGKADDLIDADGSGTLSFAQAQGFARAWATELAGSNGQRTDRYTVGDALDDYLAAFRGKSLASTKAAIETRVRPELGKLLVRELTSARMAKFLRDQADRPAVYRANKKGARKLRPVSGDPTRTRRATANRIFTPLKAALNLAFSEGRVADDTAWRRVKPFPNTGSPRVRYFTPAEIDALLRAAEPRFRALIQAALFTGARWSEIYKARIRDFDPRAGVLLLPETKGGRPRHVHLSDNGIAFFKARIMGRPLAEEVFLNEHGRAYGASHQVRPMRDTCVRAGVEPAGFHILRHTYGSTLAMAGVPMAVIAEALGHADERITRKHYAHLSPSYVRDTVRAGLGGLGAFAGGTGLKLVS